MKAISLFIVIFNILLYISAVFIANSFDITQLVTISKVIYAIVFVMFNLGFIAFGLGIYLAKETPNLGKIE